MKRGFLALLIVTLALIVAFVSCGGRYTSENRGCSGCGSCALGCAACTLGCAACTACSGMDDWTGEGADPMTDPAAQTLRTSAAKVLPTIAGEPERMD